MMQHKQIRNYTETPVSSQIVLSNKCPLNCIFCTARYRDRSIEFNKNDLFQALEDLAGLGCKAIEITGGGEPLTYSYFEKTVEKILSLGMEVALVTNGVLLSKYPKELFNNFEWIRVSINASRDNYAKIHRADLYDDALAGLAHIKDGANITKGVSYIFSSDSSTDDLQCLINDIKDFNLDYIRVAKDVTKKDFDLPRMVEGVNYHGIPAVIQGDRDYSIPKNCVIGWFKPAIDCDGHIYPCCITQYERKMSMGHCRDLKKVWKDKLYKPDVKKCSYCIYRDANDFLWGIKNQKLQNINFI